MSAARWLPLLVVAAFWAALSTWVAACPFCVPVQKTFSEEIDNADAVIIAEMVSMPAAEDNASGDLQKSKFQIVEVIKGQKLLGDMKSLEILYFGEGKVGGRFILTGIDPPQIVWSTPTLLSPAAEKYVRDAMSLPKSGPERLAYFQNFLEGKEELLARDSYDEFARAPYADVVAMKDKMNHAQLVAWIKDADIPAGRRRLYLTMLGVCGDQNDGDMIEGMLRSNNKDQKAGLDALIACYMRLKGEESLPLIEDLYLKNTKAEYADTYSAIMALRFHGQETDVIPRERIVKSLHHMLDRPELADLVIVDLARWEDWSVMDRLVDLFKKADDKSSWVRVPVVRYLMACPKPEAKKHLEELEKVDESAVKRAKTFFPFEGSGDAAPAATSSIEEPAPVDEAIVETEDAPSLPLSPEEPAISPVAHVSAALPAPASQPANHLRTLTVVLGLAGVAVAAMLLLRSPPK